MSTFEQFQLAPPLLKALQAMKFETPTPIQAKAIPVGLEGRDVMGMAQTGTGKTGAFGIPLVMKLLANPSQNALILAPTRELAVQIHTVFQQLTAQTPNLVSSLIIGGTSMKFQLREVSKNPRIIIATPGRLMDHLRRKSNLLANTGALVLDEADRMLDMGFLPQLNAIKRFLPKQRQTFMFSATFPSNIRKLAAEYLHNPVEVSVGAASKPVVEIQQAVVETTQKGKNEKLVDELNARQGSVLVFARTKHRTNRLTRYLMDCGYKAAKIHGDCSQSQRQTAIESFRSGKIRVLVATDIASRGLDIDNIGHVINYDLPQAPEDYVHRIGRTGRNGKTGHSLALITPEDRSAWQVIARFAGLTAGSPPSSGGRGAPKEGFFNKGKGDKKTHGRRRHRHWARPQATT